MLQTRAELLKNSVFKHWILITPSSNSSLATVEYQSKLQNTPYMTTQNCLVKEQKSCCPQANLQDNLWGDC